MTEIIPIGRTAFFSMVLKPPNTWLIPSYRLPRLSIACIPKPITINANTMLLHKNSRI